jgi:hypothetical protein
MTRTFFLFSVCLLAADSRKPSAAITRKNSAANEAMGGISAPVLGYVTNAARTEMRAILGVPSSSEISGPIEVPAALQRVFPAPGNERALAETAEGLVAVSMSGEVVRVSPISRIQRLAFSPSGRFAMVQSEASYFVVSLDGRAQQRELLSPGMSLTELAVDDSGTVAIGSGEDGSIHLLPALEGGQATRVISRAQSVSAMAFVPGASTLLVADSERGAVFAIGDPAGSPSVRMIAEGLPQEPMFLAASMRKDGGAVGVLPKSSMAFRLNLADGRIEWLRMPIRPTMLQRVRNGDSFLVSAEDGEPAWLLSLESPMQVTFSMRKEQGR